MHEMSIAQNVIDIVRGALPADDGAPVRSVRLRIGRMAGVVPASLEFCFGVLASGTKIEGAALVIDEVPVAARCEECGATSVMPFPFGECPVCGSGSGRMTMASGMELQVVEIELADDPDDSDDSVEKGAR
jgi:hydrogenase nickel incorporation protein HypA/HybF